MCAHFHIPSYICSIINRFLQRNSLLKKILGSLSRDVLQSRTSTGSGLFAFLDSGFDQMSMGSLPVDVRCSSPLLFA